MQRIWCIAVGLVSCLLLSAYQGWAVQATCQRLECMPATGATIVGPQGKYRCTYLSAGDGADIYINGRFEHHGYGLFIDSRYSLSRRQQRHISFAFSADGAHYAYIIDTGRNSVTAIVDGKRVPGIPYDDLIELSGTGKHYWFRTKEETLLVDGIDCGQVSNISMPPLVDYSVDDKEVACVTVDGKDAESLYRNGKKIFTATFIPTFGFFPDGTLRWTASFWPRHGDSNDHTGWYNAIYIDGICIRKLPWDTWIVEMVVTPNGKHSAYHLEQGELGARTTSFIIDGKISQSFQGATPCQLSRGGGWDRPFTVDDNGNYLAVLERKTGENTYDQRVVINGVEEAPYSQVCCATLSPSGKHYAYLGQNTSEGYDLILDGKKILGMWTIDWGVPFRLVWDRQERPVMLSISEDHGTWEMRAGNYACGPYTGTLDQSALQYVGDQCIYPALGSLGNLQQSFFINGDRVDTPPFDQVHRVWIADNQYQAIVSQTEGSKRRFMHFSIPLK